MSPRTPEILGELGHVVKAHSSLNRTPSETWGNAETLAVIGRRILPAVVADILSQKPDLHDPVALDREIESKLNHEMYDEWVTACGLRKQVFSACPKEQLLEPEETNTLIHSWVGAVYLQDGMTAVLSWLGTLIDPEFDPRKRARPADAAAAAAPAPLSLSLSQPQPPLSTPPPIPPGGALPPITSSAANQISRLHELANKGRFAIEWRDAQTGSSHQPVWTCECYVNGQRLGSGSAHVKKEAREAAAREACQALTAAR